MTVRPLHILCDMDGTLIDTEGLKDEAWRRAVGEVVGTSPDPAEHRRLYTALVGSPGIRVAADLIEHYRLSVSPEELWRIREKYRQALYADRRGLRALGSEPLIGLIRRLRDGMRVTGRGRIVLVTTAGRDQVDAVMDALDIRSLFDDVVSGLEKSAANPECYRAALSKLGCRAEDCLALEDSTAGYRAARALDIPCLLLPNAYTREQHL